MLDRIDFLSKNVQQYGCMGVYCLIVLLVSLIVQYSFNLIPCPLCCLQRAVLVVQTTACLIAWWQAPKWWIVDSIYNVLNAILALLGAVIAGRHIWLMHQSVFGSSDVGQCIPSLYYMLRYLPLAHVWQNLMQPHAACTTMAHSWWGPLLPIASFACFMLLFGWCLRNLIRILFFQYKSV